MQKNKWVRSNFLLYEIELIYYLVLVWKSDLLILHKRSFSMNMYVWVCVLASEYHKTAQKKSFLWISFLLYEIVMNFNVNWQSKRNT